MPSKTKWEIAEITNGHITVCTVNRMNSSVLEAGHYFTLTELNIYTEINIKQATNGTTIVEPT